MTRTLKFWDGTVNLEFSENEHGVKLAMSYEGEAGDRHFYPDAEQAKQLGHALLDFARAKKSVPKIGVAKGLFLVPSSIDNHNDDVEKMFNGDGGRPVP